MARPRKVKYHVPTTLAVSLGIDSTGCISCAQCGQDLTRHHEDHPFGMCDNCVTSAAQSLPLESFAALVSDYLANLRSMDRDVVMAEVNRALAVV